MEQPSTIQVTRCAASDSVVEGQLEVSADDGTFTWTPLYPLQRKARYRVCINKQVF
jgi:hypothetical protein